MENINNKNNDNGKAKFVIIAIVVVLAAIVIGILVSRGGGNEKALDASLKEMGKSFYENFYYEQIGSSADERTSLLSKFTNVGIKIDLDNLSRYNDGEFKEEISKFKNNKTNDKCNKTNTRVVIYPKSPYGKTDYTIKTELDCGFSDKK